MKPTNLTIASEKERKTILYALRHYGHYCSQKYEHLTRKGYKTRYSHEDLEYLKKYIDLCTAIQERIKAEESKDPFCANCKEDHCEVSEDGTCKMIRVYLGKK